MNLVKKNWLIAFLLLAVLIFTIGTEKQVHAQEQEAEKNCSGKTNQADQDWSPPKIHTTPFGYFRTSRIPDKC